MQRLFRWRPVAGGLVEARGAWRSRLLACKALRFGVLLVGLALMVPQAVEAQLAQERTQRELAVKLEKLETTLQPLMQKHGVDMWIIYTRENDPDPLIQLFGDYINTASGHRNAYIFYDPGT